MAERENKQREKLLAALARNGKRRAKAADEVRAARDELRDLLADGRALGLGVAGMSKATTLSRDTAHRLLREAAAASRRAARAKRTNRKGA
jgi:hypothetical protein